MYCETNDRLFEQAELAGLVRNKGSIWGRVLRFTLPAYSGPDIYVVHQDVDEFREMVHAVKSASVEFQDREEFIVNVTLFELKRDA